VSCIIIVDCNILRILLESGAPVALTLTTEQREELIEDLMALKDAVEEEEVCSAPEKDFA